MKICYLCKKEFKNYLGLSSHIRQNHKIKSSDYYDQYLKNENEGICVCGKKTKFYSISEGYIKFCSKKCSSNSDKVRNKIKQTNIKKYDVDNPTKNKDIIEKIKNTNIKKYGTEYSFQNKNVRNKIKQTNIKKYGFDNPTKNKKIIEKVKQTKINNYIINVYDLLNINSLVLISKYNNNRNKIYVKCLNCSTIFETTQFNLYQNCGKCPNCFPKYRSIGETELLEFIKSIEQSEIIENSKDIIQPYELDIYIPDKNVAIEYNGLYWHSEEQGKDKNYHLNKTELCEKQNIRLIHIFEDEWIFKQDIVKSRLKQILGLNNNIIKIYDRNCTIKEVTPKIKNEFLETYHIQGEDKSNIKLGAFYDDELISIMTFSHGSISKGYKSKYHIYELNRLCSNYNYHIPDTASKLLTYFQRNYEWKEIFSYTDRRWSQGNVYYKLGFKLEHITKPNYWYIKNGIRIHRFNLRKRSDKNKNESKYNIRLKESYIRVWDCGNYKFKLGDK